MIPGRLRPCSDQDLERLNDAAWRINETVGMRIHSDVILGRCEQAGAIVDRQGRVARFPRPVIERLLPEPFAGRQRPGTTGPDAGSVDYVATGEERAAGPAQEPGLRMPEQFQVSYGEVTFFLHDWERGARRAVTTDEMAELVRLGDAIPEVRRIATPVTPADVPAVIEALHSVPVMLRNTSKPCGGGIRLPEQADYFVQISRIYESYTGVRDFYVQSSGCLTTPMTLGERTAGIVERLMAHGYTKFRFSSMPIAGGNAPVTV
ncbi:MAG TPA: trimethylamine methyltransferase family protein, partial [Armatimonadota bacterium]|nr:trimethylamine methyltransferase family protein [Armatimonadota bacterium]